MNPYFGLKVARSVRRIGEGALAISALMLFAGTALLAPSVLLLSAAYGGIGALLMTGAAQFA